MKAISLWQPWASAIAIGAKIIETRSWSTKHRGALLIHASKKLVHDMATLGAAPSNWMGAAGLENTNWKRDLPQGALVAIADLIGCVPVEDLNDAKLDAIRQPDGVEPLVARHYTWTERMLGDFSPGRFGWVLKNVRQLPEPIPYRGRQRLFDVPDELIKRCHDCQGRGTVRVNREYANPESPDRAECPVCRGSGLQEAGR